MHQVDIGDAHGFVGGFAHVVNRQRRHGDGGQGFHFDSGPCRHLAGRGDIDGAVTVTGFQEFNGNGAKGQGMAEGDQVRRAFGGHDPGKAGDREHVALGDATFAYGGEGVR